MFSQGLGTRSIKDFNYAKHSNGSMINLIVAKDQEIKDKRERKYKSINLNNRLDDSILE
jgi:hypothetical protein